VPGPLRDRMEVIEIPGYTQSDKLHIARQYLVPRQLDANGLEEKHVKFKDQALRLIIEGYTREAGVRSLERNIGGVIRGIAAEVVSGKTDEVTVDNKAVEKYLGPLRFEPELASRTSVPGVATGMAYTPVGGDILFIEATRFPGKGGIILTGQIGEVMKEYKNKQLAEIGLKEYQKFLALKILVKDLESSLLSPSENLDKIWHIHVCSGTYEEDCKKICGSIICHTPIPFAEIIMPRYLYACQLYTRYFGTPKRDEGNIFFDYVPYEWEVTQTEGAILIPGCVLTVEINDYGRCS